MARIRSIHPGLFTDEAFVSLSPAAQVLWIGLWCEADDQGVFQWKPTMLKMRILPASTDPIVPLLEELADAECIQQYTCQEREYGVIRNFVRYQRPKAPKEVHPLPPSLRSYAGFTPTGRRPSAGTGRKKAETPSEHDAPSNHDEFETTYEEEDAYAEQAEEPCPPEESSVPKEFRTGSEAVRESERRGRREEEGGRYPSREQALQDGAGVTPSHAPTPAPGHTREGRRRAGAAPGTGAPRPPPDHGLDSDAWDDRDATAGGAR